MSPSAPSAVTPPVAETQPGPTSSPASPVPPSASPGPAGTHLPDRAHSPARPGRFRVVLGPEPTETEQLLTPETVKGWSSSLAFHVLLLLTLAFTVLSQPPREAPSLETSLPAGNPAGSDLGQQLTGGLGIDEPLAMPYTPLETPDQPVTGLTTPTAALSPELASPLRAPSLEAEASARGGGVTLDGSGQAGSGDGFGVAKFGLGGKELVNDVEIKVGNPQFTLIWNTSADLDLHVLEPGGSHIYWERRRGADGGELDVDDIDGLGPENIFWGGGLNRGNGPPGEYRWYVHYYGGRDGNLPTRWKVRLKHNGAYKVFEGRLNAIGQRSKIYSFSIDGKPTDVSPRDAEMPDRDRTPASFDNPPSPNARSQDAFGAGITQNLDDPEPPARDPRTRAEPAQTSPARPRTAEPPRPSGPPRDPSGWVIVEPTDAQFRALFPADPFEELRTLEDRPGQPELHSWKLDRGEGGLAISYLDIPPGHRGTPVETFLENEARALATEIGATQIDIRPITIGSVAARELRGSVPDRLVAGGGQIRARLVVRDGRLFRVDAIGTPAFLALPEVERFLNAFTLKD